MCVSVYVCVRAWFVVSACLHLCVSELAHVHVCLCVHSRVCFCVSVCMPVCVYVRSHMQKLPSSSACVWTTWSFAGHSGHCGFEDPAPGLGRGWGREDSLKGGDAIGILPFSVWEAVV